MQILRTPDADALRRARATGEVVWLDLDDPTDDALNEMGGILKLQELALEDSREFGQRPKADVYENELLLVYFGAGIRDGQPVTVEVHVHVGTGFVLSVHRQACAKFDEVRKLLGDDPPSNEHWLIYRIVDALSDSILDVLDGVSARVDGYAREVFHRPQARLRDEMAHLRAALEPFRRVFAVQRQEFDHVVERLGKLRGLNEDFSNRYRDIGDHLWRAADETEAARDSLQAMLETYANEVQERLTIVATIFLPLTVVTGFFGMNFNWMLNHIGSAGFFWGLGVGGMFASGLGILAWLVYSGLLNRPRRPRGLARGRSR